MEEQKRTLAEMLLSIKAVRLQPDKPFTWASGWLSPIYCDNRKVNSYPEVRTYVKEQLAAIIREQFPDVEAVAGVATGAISQGALVADLLNLPFAYVRPKPKDHGVGNQIEGELKEATKVVVVEDLISTGGSSLKAVEALKAAGMEVLGMVASYTYGFPQAEEAFEKAGVRLITITDYEHVVQQAAATGYISPSDVEILRQWRKAPQEWGKS
jgi:orotate phosphoribosyltransferase